MAFAAPAANDLVRKLQTRIQRLEGEKRVLEIRVALLSHVDSDLRIHPIVEALRLHNCLDVFNGFHSHYLGSAIASASSRCECVSVHKEG